MIINEGDRNIEPIGLGHFLIYEDFLHIKEEIKYFVGDFYGSISYNAETGEWIIKDPSVELICYKNNEKYPMIEYESIYDTDIDSLTKDLLQQYPNVWRELAKR